MSAALIIHLPEDIPDYLSKARVFRDRNHGFAMIAEWEGEDWLFVRINDSWVSRRRITEEERQTVERIFNQYTGTGEPHEG